jgi:nitrogen fixation protein FixH
MNTASIQQNEKLAQFLWTGFVLSFFLIQAVIWTVAISITANDASHAVVAGYDQQALNWDEVKAAQLASTRLGWTADLQVDRSGDILGNRVITLKLQSRQQQPINNATVTLVAHHRGQAANKQHIELGPIASGVYSGTIRIDRDGIWKFTGTAKRTAADGKTEQIGQDVFLIEQQLTLALNRGGQ